MLRKIAAICPSMLYPNFYCYIRVNCVLLRKHRLENIALYFLGCGTVRVELKLRFTGYRLRFTVSWYGLNKPRTAKVGAISKAQKVQNFQNTFLWVFFMKNSQKRFTQRKPSVLGKRFRSSDIAAGTNTSTCFEPPPSPQWNGIYFGNNVKISDIALYSGYYVQISHSIEKKGTYASKKTTNCKSRAHFLLKCAD